MTDTGKMLQLGFPFQGASQQPVRWSLFGPRVHVELVREPGPEDTVVLRNSADIYAFVKPIESSDRERFISILLSQKYAVIGVEEVSVGSLSQAVVCPREVLKSVVLSSAAAFVVAHNHPSGDPTPSQEDILITRRLREVGDLLGARLLDHVVIGDGRYVSLAEGGYW